MIPLLRLLALLLTLLFGQGAIAQVEHPSGTLQAFVALEGLAGSGQRHLNDDDSWVNADLIFGWTHDKFRVFGEYFITAEEHDLERFQLGYEFVPDTVLWVGRFHQPASAWNTEHHHGRYLQTAITRPSIEHWEDEEGIVPQHVVGALIESRRPFGSQGGMQVSGGLGAAPSLTADDLAPVNIFGNNPRKYGLSVTARIAFLPEYAGTNSVGLLYAHDQIYVRDPIALVKLLSNHATLSLYGAYVDWSDEQWRVISALYQVELQLDRPTPNERFTSGYAQLERHISHELTLFARLEDSANMQRSRYIALFNDHSGDIDVALRRQIAGLRWDYTRHQALTSEVLHVNSLDQHAYQLRVQWSAAIP